MNVTSSSKWVGESDYLLPSPGQLGVLLTVVEETVEVAGGVLPAVCFKSVRQLERNKF